MRCSGIPYQLEYRARYSDSREAIFEVSTGKRYTYGELVHRTCKLACFLKKILKLGKGERIGFCSTNQVAMIDAYYVCSKTGLIMTTYNEMLRVEELIQLIENEQPQVLFYSHQFVGKVKELKQHFKNIYFICVNDTAAEDEKYCYDDIMEMEWEDDICCEELEETDTLMLIHTGGTTGRPKAARLTYKSLFYNHVAAIMDLRLSADDCALIMLPLYHTAAWNVLLMPLLMVGGRIIFMEKFETEKAFDLIRTERPSVTIGVSTIFLNMASSKKFADMDFSCFRFMISGAAPIARAILEKYWDRGIKLANAYGMTEIGPNNLMPPIHDITIEQLRAKWNTVGKPICFNQVRVVDEKGKILPAGEKGELIWKSPLCFGGYWNAEVETQAVCQDGWIHSGDIGYYDEDNYYYICGRSKNTFISGGENIFPAEIEEVIHRHPDVEDCCVIGVPDELWNEVGKLLVVKKADSTLDKNSMKQFIKEHLPTIKQPKYICFVKKIPVNSAGKRNIPEIKKIYGNAAE